MIQSQTTTIDKRELEHFSNIAQEWWDPEGKFRPLHKFNPTRLAYIKKKICEVFNRDFTELSPLKGLRILDIGCGGGLLTEPLAFLGATIVGADASERNIEVAKIHAQKSGASINYRATTAEALADAGERFDVVLNMEVVEHVNNVPLFMKACCTLVKPEGLMFVATLNRTWKSFLLAIVAAEHILRWLPKGTHDYQRFLKPEEIKAYLSRNHLSVIDQTGVVYSPLYDRWNLSLDMDVNYMLLARKAAC